MVAVLEKEDVPPISRTIHALDRVQRHADENFEQSLDRWWAEVRDLAKSLCPVDTGTLQATIRIIFGPVGSGVGFGAFFEVVASPNDIEVSRMLVAGGLLINPKTGRICDYAEIVHDGGPTSRGISVRDGTFFLEQAILIKEPELRIIMDKFMRGQQAQWSRD